MGNVTFLLKSVLKSIIVSSPHLAIVSGKRVTKQ